MADPEELLQASDWYEHDGPHRPIFVALGAIIGYWYGQPDWRSMQSFRNSVSAPAAVSYTLDRVDDCCSSYGFRKGYRFRNNDYADRQNDEEVQRFRDRETHIHNPLAVARGTVVGYAHGRTGNIKPELAPAEMIQSCCAKYGFWQGFSGGNAVFFINATEAETRRFFDAERAQRNQYGWG